MKKKNTDIFGALADPNRRKILLLLSAGVLTVSALVEQFEVSRPAISKHIKILEENNLVAVTDQGRERFCELQQQGFQELFDWIKFYDVFWNEKLNNLDNYLNQNS
jgi:DNA-binding transcriptional ArsR family regulator